MTEQRRATDSNKATDIEAMIAAEDDSKTRALLIVLNSINNSMTANTAMTREVASKLEVHLTNYENHVNNESDMVSRGMGAWKVMAWVLGVAQLLTLASVNYINTRFGDHEQSINGLKLRDEQVVGRVEQNTGRITAIEERMNTSRGSQR